MKKLLLREAAKHKLQNRRRKRWQKTVSILACLVVFCTVYALILPALTAEADTYCGKEEHTHTDACYEEKLICGQEEGQGAHHHTDDCYREVEALVCQTPESEGHQHTEACYTEEQVLTCTNKEEGHVHNEFDGCYTTEKKLTCGMEEGEGAHHHTAECYEKKKELICGQEENDGHHHTAECYKKELICGKEEHTHTLACYSNPDADVENGDVWQNTVSSVTLTGNWGADLAAIAQTQTGYTESTANYAVAEDGQTIHGYTRYGAWANDPYRDNWSAQFADFCLSYAGVPTSAVPQNSDCSAWNYTNPDGYTPKTGDLLLLDTDNNGSADHAGIIITADDSTLTAIVGDADKAVRNNTYSIGSENIKGYVSIPENPALATPTPEPTKEAGVTPEAQPTQEPEATPEVTEEPTQEPENKADDTANNIEVIPTPTITPETMQKVQLEQQTVTAELYTDSTYATAEQSENAVVVSGNLPENGSVKAFPVNNISMEGMKVLCAWDITIFDAEGNKWEPADGNTLSVKFQIPDLTEKENKAGEIYYIPDENADRPEKLESQISDNGVSFEAEHFSIYTLMVADNVENENNSQKIDLKNFLTDVEFQKKTGNDWTDVGDNEVLDRNAAISFMLKYTLPKDTLSADKKTITYTLPEQLKDFKGKGNVEGTGGKVVGTYEIVNGVVSITFGDEYVNKNKNNAIDGWLRLSAKADEIKTDTNNKTEIKFNDKCIVNVEIQEEEIKKGDITIKKENGDIDIENGTIVYKVTVTSKYGTSSEVKLKDVMSKLRLDGTVTAKKNGTEITVGVTGTEDGFTTKLDKMEAGDTYELIYRAKLPERYQGTAIKAHNSIEAKSTNSENKEITSKSEIDTVFDDGTIKKSGVNNGNGTVTWTITINEQQNDISGWTLKDILNGNTELNGTKATIDPPINGETEITLPYTFPVGCKEKYTIKYTTTDDRPYGESNVKNKAVLTKDGTDKGTADREVWIGEKNPYIKKGTGIESDSDSEILTLKWHVDLAITKDMENGWTFVDTPNNDQYFTPEQREALRQALNKCLGEGKYSLTDSNGKNSAGNWTSIKITGNQPLKKGNIISFDYQTTAVKPTTETNFSNSASFDNKWFGGGNSYKPPKPVVKKVDANNENGGSDTTHDYNDSAIKNGILKWKIEVNLTDEMKKNNKLILTEHLPEGVTLESLKKDDTLFSWAGNTGSISGTCITAQKNENDIVITIPKEAYQNDVNSFIFKIDVKMDEVSDWTKAKVYKNTVIVTDEQNREWGAGEQTQTITNNDETKVVRKSGKKNGNDASLLEYSVVINPKGKDLLQDGEGGTLNLKDILEYHYNPWDSKAKITLVPGSVVVYLMDSDGTKGSKLSSEEYSYTYREEATNTGKNNNGDPEQNRKNILELIVPDNKALILEYQYKCRGEVGKWVNPTNTASLYGNGNKKDSDSTTTDSQLQDSSAGANVNGITIYKVDSANNGLYLEGAEFDLYKWDNQKKDYVIDQQSLTSNDDGEIEIENLKHNQAYKLVETKAPDGYEISDEIVDGYLFYISDPNTTTYPSIKPDNFTGHYLTGGQVVYYPNTKSSSYILPETGGIGTNRFTAVGLALMAGSLLCGYVMRRKRRERREI